MGLGWRCSWARSSCSFSRNFRAASAAGTEHRRGRQCRREWPRLSSPAATQSDPAGRKREGLAFGKTLAAPFGREAAVSARQEAADVEVPAGRDYEWPEVPSSHAEPSSPCPALPEVSTGQTFAPHITNPFKRAAGSLVPGRQALVCCQTGSVAQKLAAISAMLLPGLFWSLLSVVKSLL